MINGVNISSTFTGDSKMKKALFLLVILLLISSSAAADKERNQVVKIVEKACRDALLILNDRDLDRDTRDQLIVDLVLPIVDFSRMVRLAIGRKHWYEMSVEKREYVADLLLSKMKAIYLIELDRYSDGDVVVTGARREGNRVDVMTDVVTQFGNLGVTYHFLKTRRGWKAVDVSILGVSYVTLYRRQFAAVLKTGTIDDLIERIEGMGE